MQVPDFHALNSVSYDLLAEEGWNASIPDPSKLPGLFPAEFWFRICHPKNITKSRLEVFWDLVNLSIFWK